MPFYILQQFFYLFIYFFVLHFAFLTELPFECPRCIRSYATRARLIRHLERSHSVATIIQQQRTTNNAMRNQLQQQQQQQQPQPHQSFISIKDTSKTTTTAVAISTSTLAVTTTSTTNSSCGKVYKGINKNQITQSQKLKMLLETDTDC